MKLIIKFLAVVVPSVLSQQIWDETEIKEFIDENVLTCGSSIRLRNQGSQYFLHSSHITFGQGSGQQVVTCHKSGKEVGDLWTVKEADQTSAGVNAKSNMCEVGEPVRCGDIIRLEHVETQKNLHSHSQFESAISKSKEVTGYGDDGEGDEADNWLLECLDDKTKRISLEMKDTIKGTTKFQLRHTISQALAVCELKNAYTNQNCPRCPIVGELEVSGQHKQTSMQTLWRIESGIFMPLNEEKKDQDDSEY